MSGPSGTADLAAWQEAALRSGWMSLVPLFHAPDDVLTHDTFSQEAE